MMTLLRRLNERYRLGRGGEGSAGMTTLSSSSGGCGGGGSTGGRGDGAHDGGLGPGGVKAGGGDPSPVRDWDVAPRRHLRRSGRGRSRGGGGSTRCGDRPAGHAGRDGLGARHDGILLLLGLIVEEDGIAVGGEEAVAEDVVEVECGGSSAIGHGGRRWGRQLAGLVSRRCWTWGWGSASCAGGGEVRGVDRRRYRLIAHGLRFYLSLCNVFISIPAKL
mmetsp:Transcript_8090/g.18076  ORF Transcript_8090/g.18076 Transcript_8090/m.18076 type:complete len:219 (-) Transcript_8090:72-728(-)